MPIKCDRLSEQGPFHATIIFYNFYHKTNVVYVMSAIPVVY